MSLERIDEYMRQLTAIKYYDKVCKELENIKKELAKKDQTLYFSESYADSLLSSIDEMQKELKEKDERIALRNSTMDYRLEYNTLLEYALKQAQKEVRSLKKERMTLMEKLNKVSRGFNLKNFFSLGVILDDKETILKRRMNAIYYWLLTNGLLRL